MEADKRSWLEAGFSNDLATTALAALKPSSRKVYDSRWKGYVQWCEGRDLDPVTADVTEVLNFLQGLANSGKKCDTVKGYLTVISQRHRRIMSQGRQCLLTELQPVQTWVRGLSVLNPRLRVIVPSWSLNLDIVLSALAGEKDPELRKLCVRDTLRAYVNATQPFRGAFQQLLLCFGKKVREEPVSKQRISTWLKKVIKDCYAVKGLAQDDHVKGRNVRKQATFCEDLAGVDPEKICQAATWQSTNKLSSMFARHYRLDLLSECPSDFGSKVLLALNLGSRKGGGALRHSRGSTLQAHCC